MSSPRGGSQIFTPFRALGLCSNYVPLALSVKGKRAFVATSVGRAFHVYDVRQSEIVIHVPRRNILTVGPTAVYTIEASSSERHVMLSS